MLSQIWGKGKYLSDHRRPFLTTQPYSPLFDETRNRYYTIPPFSKWDLEVWILVLYKDILAQRFSTRKTILKNIVKFTRKILYWSLVFINVFFFFFSVCVFFYDHSRITGLQRKRESFFFNSTLPLPPTSQALRH